MTIDPARFLVAHRGDQEYAVENTLAAFEAAAQAGAQFAECDIQFSHDFVPVILHDHTLKKLGIGSNATTSQLSYAELTTLCGQHYPLLSFQTLLQWLQHHPDITLFSEIKPSILRRKSAALAVQSIINMIPEAVQPQIILISQSALLVEACCREFIGQVGWVAEYHRIPETNFAYLFLPATDVEKAAAWQQRGVQCVVYTINDAKQVRALLDNGIDLIETNHFQRMTRAIKGK